MTTIETIEEYLKKMNLIYRVVPQEDRIILPYKIHDKRFYLLIDRTDKWVRFHSRFLESEQVGSVDKLALYKALLEANGNLAEVKYYITEKGDIGVVGHESVQSLTFEGFESEYKALPFAISFFIENIASKLNLNVPGFE